MIKKPFLWFIALISAHPALAAVVAGVTGGAAAVVLRFDDPIVWGCASSGVAYGFFQADAKSWKVAMAKGIAGFNFGGFGGPWLTAEIADHAARNPLPGYLVAFALAAFWPQLFEFTWPILVKARAAIREAIKSAITAWGKK